MNDADDRWPKVSTEQLIEAQERARARLGDPDYQRMIERTDDAIASVIGRRIYNAEH